MSALSHPIAMAAPFTRSVAIAALMGATILAAGMVTATRADSATTAPLQLAQAAAPQPDQAAAPQSDQSAAAATDTQGETVEQRITSLHTALKITPKEDAKWNNVAQAMRQNVAALQKLAAEKTTEAPQSMTAIEDLKTYQKFAQAHVDGLKNLTSSFETLYDSMPAAQKKLTDQVFQNFHRNEGAPSHS